jgi:hypothetical protein
LIAAILVNYLELPYMYLFVVIFALVSLLQDQKIKSVISSTYNKTRKKFYKRVEKESEISSAVENNLEFQQKFF